MIRTAAQSRDDLLSDATPFTGRALAAATVDLAGVALDLMPEGVAWWPDERILIVADLHFEKGSSHARRGAFLPPYDTAATLAQLGLAITRLQPKTVISLGDAFHDPFGEERLSPADRATLAALQRGRDWIWIAGNHDRGMAATVGGTILEEASIGPFVFRHEPSPDWGEDAASAHAIEVCGHLHPTARVALVPKSVRRRCFATDGRRLMLPAFGAYTGGLNILGPAYRGLFKRDGLSAHLLGDGRVYSFPGTWLRGD